MTLEIDEQCLEGRVFTDSLIRAGQTRPFTCCAWRRLQVQQVLHVYEAAWLTMGSPHQRISRESRVNNREAVFRPACLRPQHLELVTRAHRPAHALASKVEDVLQQQQP